jgi:two-component SAPR family response regulator
MKYFLLCCFVFFIQAIGSKTTFSYGLAFNSYEVEKENRTSLNLTPEEPFTFSDGFILEFDVLFNKVLSNFGYIFRIVGNNNAHIDLLLNQDSKQHGVPQITAIYKSGQELCNLKFEELNTDFDNWIKIKVAIDPKNHSFKQTINHKVFEAKEDYFGEMENMKIVFGKNDFLSFETSDVPCMLVRDIYIKDINGKPLFYWKLSQHTNDGVYDGLKNYFATCKNPKWLLDKHAYWKKTASFKTGIYPQVAFDGKNNQVAVIDKKTFYLYDLKAQSLKTDFYTGGFPLGNKSNQMAYNPSEKVWFTYDFTGEAAVYDTLTRMWNNVVPNTDDPRYWYHNSYFSEADTTLYTFGGYGFHSYKNEMRKYHFTDKTWEYIKYNGDSIPPRYLAGIGALDEKTLLIFGGYGSEKGDQKLSPHNYYDLYSFDLKSYTAKKIWELNDKQHNFVIAGSLVVDTLNKCFYALCFSHQKFNTTLALHRFSTEEPSAEILADSIPYFFSDISSYADLFFSSDGKQLIAITSHMDERKSNAEINIYTLAFPPFNETDLFQPRPKSAGMLFYILGFVFILVLLLFFLWQVCQKKGWRKPGITEITRTDDTPQADDNYHPIVGIKPINEKHGGQSILLYGGFQVIDMDGNNITAEFTPILKQLFLLILLYTLKDGKGISSVKLKEILWFDKSNESAKNNRGVSLNKLRTIFEKIGEISINGTNSYWTIVFEESIYCDYYEAMVLMNRLAKNTGERDIKDINRLVSIVSAGELLPNLQTEWVDSFKSDLSNRLIDLLLDLVMQPSSLELNPAIRINIADAVFVHDSLNEDALKIKCVSLVQMGKNNLAQKVYSSFIKEYHSLFGVDFKYTFEQIIS